MSFAMASAVRGTLPATAVAVAVALLSFGYRLLSFDLTDDDYLFFAIGRQIQEFGAWPVRDLVEEGDPLHNVTSAVLQAVFGYRLAGEVLFDLVMMSLAAALTFLLAHRLSRSTAVAVAVVVVVVFAAARLYDYPKAVLPVLGLWLCFRYHDRPSRYRAAGLGLATGLAFLFRHDLGAYVGLASLLVIVVHPVRTSISASGAAAYVAALSASVIPYLAYLQVHGGVTAYVASTRGWIQREVGRDRDPRPRIAIDFSQPLWQKAPGLPIKVRWATEFDEAVRTDIERKYSLESGQRDEGRTWRYVLRDLRRENLRAIVYDPDIEDTANIDRAAFALPGPGVAESTIQRLRHWLRQPPSVALAPGVFTQNNATAWLYYLTVALPYLALATLAVARLRRGVAPADWMEVLVVSVVSAAAAPLWLRGNLNESSRLADLAGPTAVLGAWLLARSLQRRSARSVRACLAAASVVAYLLTAGSVASVAQVVRGADAALVAFDAAARRAEFDPRVNDLLASPPPLSWLSKETGMRGAVEYLRSCTAADDRVLVYGFFPEILFFSGRGFAADRVVLYRGFWTKPHEQQRTIDAIRRTRVPVVLIDVASAGNPPAGKWLDPSMSLIDRYVSQNYVSSGTSGFGASTDVVFNVLVDKDLTPAGIYQPFGLPCFVPMNNNERRTAA